MRTTFLVSGAVLVLAVVSLSAAPAPAPATVSAPANTPAVSWNDVAKPPLETVIIFRHGEKPAGGEGQLTPQGFNRALALPNVLAKKFGKPDYLFAPDPHERVKDGDGLFYYIRPLATIEPTAIQLGMPVQTPFGYREVDDMLDELCKPQYAHATIFVAWEHGYGRQLASDLYKKFGGRSGVVPEWKGEDYDSLFVVTIRRPADQEATAAFAHDSEGLDHLSTNMPMPGK